MNEVRVCLVSPPTAGEHEDECAEEWLGTVADELALGVLSLAAALEKAGVGTEVCNLNYLLREHPDVPEAVEALAGSSASVFGFGTICNTYPLTVRLARDLKRARPDAAVIFGGPQASAVDLETLAAFPFVDAVVRGEAEETLLALLDALGSEEKLAGVPGIAFRRGGLGVRTPDAALPDIDALPVPAYHLWPAIERTTTLPIEAGRGCPFGCAFCSTSRFFHRRFRFKAPRRIIEEMRNLARAYPDRRLDLLHDAFTVNRRRVVEFCRALLEIPERFRWTCSARTDCVDDELLGLMSAAGCTDIYFGIETGSARMQRAIRKRLDLDEARESLRAADRHSIATTVSLITGFPEERMEDLRATLSFLMDAARIPSVDLQFHLVAPLAGSALFERYRDRVRWDGIFSDMSFQGQSQDPADRALVIEHPEVFPDFYALPTLLDRGHIKRLRNFLIGAVARFRWLTVALEHEAGGALELFARWCVCRPGDAGEEYYAGPNFRRDFLAFAAVEREGGTNGCRRAVSALLEYERECERAEAAKPPEPAQPYGTGLDAVPCPAPGITLVSVHDDYQAIVESLKRRRPLGDVPTREVTLAHRQIRDGRTEVLQLSPLAAALLRLCDGMRTVRDIAARFGSLQDGLDAFPPEAACAFSLAQLAQQGLVVLAAPAPA